MTVFFFLVFISKYNLLKRGIENRPYISNILYSILNQMFCLQELLLFLELFTYKKVEKIIKNKKYRTIKNIKKTVSISFYNQISFTKLLISES